MNWSVLSFFLFGFGVSHVAGITITFSANMREPIDRGLFAVSSGDSVILRGSWNGWQDNSLKLVDENGDGIFIGSFDITGETGSDFEYKFVILKANGALFWEWNPNPDNPPHGNRKLKLKGSSQTSPTGLFKIDRYDLAAVGEEVEFSVAELLNDFDQMRQALEEEHCCLYEYTDKATFEDVFAKQRGLIDGPMQPHQFYRILTPITALVGCGHTNFWMPGRFWNAAADKLFPLKIDLIDNDVVIADSYGDTNRIPIGSTLHSINGRSIDDIIDELKRDYSADAFNPHFIRSQVERRFPMLFARIYGFTDSYTVTYTAPGGNTSRSAELIPADIGSVRAEVFKTPQLGLEILPERNAAILTINSFIYYDRVPMFTGFIDSCFVQIHEKKIDNLILDLRGNDGGDPFCAAPLFSYLEREPLPYFAKRYGKYSDFADPIPLAENHFAGNLFTLIDGRCFSTNGHFCSLLKYHRIGKFIGTEGGSSFSCNANIKEIHLDNSQIMLYVPRGSFAAAVEGMDKTRGITPDYTVVQTYEDFLNDRDTVMAFTLALIDSVQGKKNADRIHDHGDSSDTQGRLSNLIQNLPTCGWRIYDRVMRFTAENLYEQIDGRAEYYIAYDVIDLTFASFDKNETNEQSINVSVFDMGTPTNAFGVFSGERSDISEQTPFGRESYRTGANYYIWKGQYYIRIIATDTTEELKRIGMGFAQRITDFLHDSGETVWGLKALPDKQLVRRSVQYFLVDALGLDFLTNTYTARYYKNGEMISVFISQQECARAARNIVIEYGEYAEKYGNGASPHTIHGIELSVCDMGKSCDIVFRKRNVVAGIIDIEDKNLGLRWAYELYEQLSLP